MSATLQELDEAIEVAVQENNTEAVEELAVLIEQAESEQGYQPTDYNLSNELGKEVYLKKQCFNLVKLQ